MGGQLDLRPDALELTTLNASAKGENGHSDDAPRPGGSYVAKRARRFSWS